MEPTMLAEKVEVDEAVWIGFEDELAGVAALGNVVGGVGRDHACKTGHDTGKCGKWAENLKKTSRLSPVL